ncbi:hypothetical protein HD806DRAFT_102014 [Xylariaceae sp. AK1471]|nr:hypothetical protein HD806DRAFT_102014 [Xylariaceae sp. AK1471]
MSIQKIAASIASLNQETTFGLVNINFDFAMKKYDAPREFQGLGRELSQARIKAAEDGAVHVTARKLGALFRQCLPSTPRLIEAYGTRASDIASDPKVNPKPSKKHGVLADHVGIDGTSIWAAATSGADSVAVHLLACMLARMWSRSEAVAIWAELVSERKKELEQTDVADPQYLTALNDSRIDITRDQLAHWDSSARAWLQSADEAMKIKQTQLMLVLNNVSLPVSTKPTLYRNVLQAWTSAMIATNSLIQGVPQSVEHASVLLGISSWHIYPDMVVLQSSQTPVRQADPLVKGGGVLTIGLNTERPSENGISWSLSLGHLRYYGGAVASERSLITQGNRITVAQLIQLSIGSMTRHWALPESTIVQFLVDIWELIEPVAQTSADGTSYWIGHLAKAVKPLLLQESLDTQVGFRLMKLGARRCPNFLAPSNTVNEFKVNQQTRAESSTVPKLFGLSDIDIFINLLKQPEDCVPYFRELVKDPSLSRFNNRLFVIRYCRTVEVPQRCTYYEYATALPTQSESRKRSHDGQEHMVLNPARHLRWIQTDIESAPWTGPLAEERVEHFRGQGEESFNCRELRIKASSGTMQWRCTRDNFINYGILHHISDGDEFDRDKFDIDSQQEMVHSYSNYLNFEANSSLHDIISSDDDNRVTSRMEEWCHVGFEVIMGSMDTAALLVSSKSPNEDARIKIKPTIGLSMPALSGAIRSEVSPVSRKKTLLYLNQLINTISRAPLLRSLRALATVSSIYDQLPNSTISLSVISQCLAEMIWIPSAEKDILTQDDSSRFRLFKLNRSSTFSCLLFLDTGGLSVPPMALPNIMAMATGDSIYIAKSLISDPSKNCLPHEICQIKGSIGKPGIALMIPPKNPLTRQMDLSNWQCVNHNAFDGQLHDSFSSTTLHLGFTDYIFPVDVGSHGNRDSEVYFLESLVSVHDRGKWVADLDILRTLENDTTWTVGAASHWKQPQFSSIGECEHVEHTKSSSTEEIRHPNLTAIDDWNEILDPPGTVAVVRSLDNWLGRLATAAVCRQLGFLVIVLPGRLCWCCIRDEWTRISTTPRPPPLKPHHESEETVPPTLGIGSYSGPEQKWDLYRQEVPLIEIMVNGVRELRSEGYVKDNMMDQGNIFLIC